MSVGCQERETVTHVFTIDNDQPIPYKEQEWVTCFQSLGIRKQESYMQGKNRFVTYAITVFSAQQAKDLIREITMSLPEFIDDDNKKSIENIIDSNTMAEARQKRRPTPLDIEINIFFRWKRIRIRIRIRIRLW